MFLLYLCRNLLFVSFLLSDDLVGDLLGLLLDKGFDLGAIWVRLEPLARIDFLLFLRFFVNFRYLATRTIRVGKLCLEIGDLLVLLQNKDLLVFRRSVLVP